MVFQYTCMQLVKQPCYCIPCEIVQHVLRVSASDEEELMDEWLDFMHKKRDLVEKNKQLVLQ